MPILLAVCWVTGMAVAADAQESNAGKQWLHDAVKEADEGAVRTALSQGESTLANTPDQFGFTPIFFARDRAIATMLVEDGADIEFSRNNLGWTPLHYAADNNMVALAEVLLEKRANLNARTKGGHTQGSTPMDLAARKFHVNVVRALVRYGADPNLPIDGGKSAMEMMPELDESHPKYESDMDKKLKRMREIISRENGEL